MVEIAKKSVSCHGNFTGIEASDWQTGESTVLIEMIEEMVSYVSTNIAGIEASRR